MDQVNGSGSGPEGNEVERLNGELAEIARATARLLLTPRYDEAELAYLDVRAREIRAAIQQAEGHRRVDDGEQESTGIFRGRILSGG